MYEVLMGAEFSRVDWAKLAAAFPAFGHGYYNPANYAHSRESVLPRQSFSVWRVDHKYLTQGECNDLYWFFRGVIAAHDIKPAVSDE
jgi:hypothetical protein